MLPTPRMAHDNDDPPNHDLESGKGKSLPTTRLGRLLKLGSLAPKAIPMAFEGAKKAMGMQKQRTEEEERDAQLKMMAEAKKVAEAMLKTLGEMKGLPLKLGQMASYIDGLAPPGYEERFQEALKKLQQKAPPLDPAAAVKVVKEELGDVPENIYAEWESDPFAAASIGQVHRATTRGGDKVAVKVQYPGIDKAIENDLKSISILEQFASPVARKYHTKEGLEEIKAVFLDELDYTREAKMADIFRRLTADVPTIVIPQVYHSLSKRRVLTTEFMEGQTYQEFIATASQEDRNRAGMAIWHFMFRSLLRYGYLYADPHPGNYRFLPDGRVAFLDFGCVKIMPKELVGGMKRYMRAALDQDWPEFDRACVEVLGFNPDDKEEWELYRSYTLELLMPITTRQAWECSPEVAREAVQSLVRGSRKLVWGEDREKTVPHIPKPIHMPPDFTFVNRLQWGLASVMGGIRTVAKFREVTEPWIREDVRELPP
jgi:predicted unusual protein kinase regulating ubiquinone biosynthesis (AarF/ABC1/UbiB family)